MSGKVSTTDGSGTLVTVWHPVRSVVCTSVWLSCTSGGTSPRDLKAYPSMASMLFNPVSQYTTQSAKYSGKSYSSSLKMCVAGKTNWINNAIILGSHTLNI